MTLRSTEEREKVTRVGRGRETPVRERDSRGEGEGRRRGKVLSLWSHGNA
jgi:hypothetical protein